MAYMIILVLTSFVPTLVAAALTWEMPLEFPPLGVRYNISDYQIRIEDTYAFQKLIAKFNMQGLNECLMTKEELQIGADCQSDVTLILNGLTKPISPQYATLSAGYFDATAKLPPGIMVGNAMWVGDYQECNDLATVKNPQTNKTFSGKYFTAVIYVNGKPMFGQTPLLMGWCLPDSCNETDTNILLNELLFYLDSTQPVVKNMNLSVVGAIANKTPEVTNGTVATIVLAGILWALILFGTILDVLQKQQIKPKVELFPSEDVQHTTYGSDSPNERTGLLSGEVFTDSGSYNVNIQERGCSNSKQLLIESLCAFSLYSNAKKLFGTETAKGPLACLNGIRVISMWWVILGHTYVFAISFLDNPVEATKIMQRFTFQPILNGTFSVDSFFFLSGLLVAYLAIKELREKGMSKTFWVYFVCHRYWRLTPLYGFVILIFTFIMRPLISGPYTAYFTPDSQFNENIDECKTSWWANLLYINNLYPNYGNLAKTCIGWGWYLANDMQFYIFISPVIIIFLRHQSKVQKAIGFSIAGFFIISCVFIRGALVIYYGLYNLNNAPTKHTDDPMAVSGPLYGRPYARWSVYVIGLLVGYLLADCNLRIRIPRLLILIGWLICLPVGLSTIYGQYYYNHHPGTSMTLTQSVFYVSLCRTLWGACLAWIVLACVSGNAGPVRDILSWKVWAPLGRLTYSAYLIHPVVIYLVYTNQLRPIHFSDLDVAYFYVGHLVFSYSIGFVISMMVEAPMIQLEKAFLKFFKRQSSP